MITHRASRKRSIRLLTHLHNELSVICTRNLSETFQKARSCDFIAISRIVFKALRSNPKRHGWPRLLQLVPWLTKLVFPWRDIECGGTCDHETMEIQKVVFEEVCSATRADLVWNAKLGYVSVILWPGLRIRVVHTSVTMCSWSTWFVRISLASESHAYSTGSATNTCHIVVNGFHI